MENLCKEHYSAIGVEDFATIVVFKRFLEHFCKEEENNHRSRLLYGEEDAEN
jgi:hypothetical protein